MPHLLAVYFSKEMDLEQSVKNLQAQNNQFQKIIFHLAKGQEELKALLSEKEKDQQREQGVQDKWKSKPKRSFTLLHMPMSQVLQQLLNQNLITLLPSYSIPTNPAPGYKYHARCAYHSNSPGHDTEDCGPLKHKIQDLIDDKIIDFHSPEEPHMANVGHNRKGRNEPNQSVGIILISTPVQQQRHKTDTPKRQFAKINMTLAEALQQLLKKGLITLKDPPRNPSTSSSRYNPNARCAYHSDSPGHDTNNCWTLKNKIQDLIDDKTIDCHSLEKPHTMGTVLTSTLTPQQRRKSDTSKRQFTNINMSLAQALQHLLRENLITLRNPPIKPNTSAPSYKPNARCAYHSNSPGHDTNDCWPLKNKIQDMIDAGEIEFYHPKTPVVITTPMPNHKKID